MAQSDSPDLGKTDLIKGLDTEGDGKGIGPTLGMDLDDGKAFEDGRYEPGTVEANLARQQGLGVGARDLAAQHDPQVAVSEEEDEAEQDEG